jgi:hypothetical protein
VLLCGVDHRSGASGGSREEGVTYGVCVSEIGLGIRGRQPFDAWRSSFRSVNVELMKNWNRLSIRLSQPKMVTPTWGTLPEPRRVMAVSMSSAGAQPDRIPLLGVGSYTIEELLIEEKRFSGE